MKTYLAKEGDCLASLAEAFGLPLERLVDANAELLELREEAGILAPGDKVKVPELEVAKVTVPANGDYVFELQVVENPVRVKFMTHAGEPRIGLRVRLDIDEHESQDVVTDGEGVGTILVPATAVAGQMVFVDEDGDEQTEQVTFGDLDSWDTVRGVQARLRHLGYYRGMLDGDLAGMTAGALMAFRRDEELVGEGDELDTLREVGEMDEETLAALKERYGA